MSMELNTVSGTLVSSAAGLRPHAPSPASSRQAQDAPVPAAVNRAEQKDARQAVAEANRQLAEKASELTFEFDESAARVIVRLVDKQTGQVLRQIPSKEALQIAQALQDEAAGALLRTDA